MRKEYKEAVITSAWRSVVRQRTLSAKTNTGLSFSYHIVITAPSDSDYYVPASNAIDISIDLPKHSAEKVVPFLPILANLLKKQV